MIFGISILDIKARDQSGRLFNVEMQVRASPAYEKRILYDGTRLHQQQLYEAASTFGFTFCATRRRWIRKHCRPRCNGRW